MFTFFFDLSSDALVYREYEVVLMNGMSARIIFTLNTLDGNTGGALYARTTDALSYGFISIRELPGCSSDPVIWTQSDEGLEITLPAKRPDFNNALGQAVTSSLKTFFKDIEPIITDIVALRRQTMKRVN